MGRYLVDLAEQRRGHPSDDVLSAFVNEKDPAGRLTREELATTAVLLLVAGHETTVNTDHQRGAHPPAPSRPTGPVAP
jgi:cytochrome P450